MLAEPNDLWINKWIRWERPPWGDCWESLPRRGVARWVDWVFIGKEHSNRQWWPKVRSETRERPAHLKELPHPFKLGMCFFLVLTPVAYETLTAFGACDGTCPSPLCLHSLSTTIFSLHCCQIILRGWVCSCQAQKQVSFAHRRESQLPKGTFGVPHGASRSHRHTDSPGHWWLPTAKVYPLHSPPLSFLISSSWHLFPHHGMIPPVLGG